MTTASAARSPPGGADAERTAAVAAGHDVGEFLAAVATVLRETIERLEGTVGRVTDSVMTRAVRVDRDLVVTLQDFDRLQQELAALSDVIAHCAATTSACSTDPWIERHGRKVIAAIAVSHVRDRFLRHLGDTPTQLAAPQSADEVVF